MLDISLEDDIFVTDPLLAFLQEIDILFNTQLTSVLGSPTWGSDFEQFLWTLHDNSSAITEYCKQLINQHTSAIGSGLEWDCGCARVQDQDNDHYYYLVIAIRNPKTQEIIHRNFVMHHYDHGFGDKSVIKSIKQ